MQMAWAIFWSVADPLNNKLMHNYLIWFDFGFYKVFVWNVWVIGETSCVLRWQCDRAMWHEVGSVCLHGNIVLCVTGLNFFYIFCNKNNNMDHLFFHNSKNMPRKTQTIIYFIQHLYRTYEKLIIKYFTFNGNY